MIRIVTLPLWGSLKVYTWRLFFSDLIAGLVTALVAVPQVMAYAQLAGLPPELGLYSAVVPLFCYACLGSSRTLVVGPAALICLLVSSSIQSLAPESSQAYLVLSVNLALLTGIFLMMLSILRLGSFANMISQPVVTGFTSASAVIIAVSQLPVILGIIVSKGNSLQHTIVELINNILLVNPVVILISLTSFVFIWVWNRYIPILTRRLHLPDILSQGLNKTASIVLLGLSIGLVTKLSLANQYDLAIVGTIPNELPTLSTHLIKLSYWPELILPASSIALLCFLTSISTGLSLTNKSQDKINPNQELLALGAANVGAALTGSFALAASLSRSMINYSSGAMTQVSNLISALVMLMSILLLTPYLANLPKAVLGTIVIFSVVPMMLIPNLRQCWQFNKGDGVCLFFTFFSTLILGPEKGIWAGIICSVVLLVHRSSKPNVVEVGRAENGYFRNIQRTQVKTLDNTLFLRVDENLFFANIQHIENYLFKSYKSRPDVKHIVIICSSVSAIDETALRRIENWITALQKDGVILHLSDVKGFLRDKLAYTNLIEQLKPGQLFYTADDAMKHLEQLP